MTLCVTHTNTHATLQAYTVCDAGEDVAGTLGAIVRSRGLSHLVPPKALEHGDPRQALRVRGAGRDGGGDGVGWWG